MFIIAMIFLPVTTAFAAGLKVQYDGKTVSFTGQQATVKVDGKTISNGQTPGLVINDYTMVPYDTIFKSGLGATCSYDSKKGIVKIKKNDITIQMTVGKTTAYVNGQKVTLPIAPKKVKYYSAGKTKVVVPAQYVATKLGYQYSWINNSKTALTIVMTSPFRIYYDSKWYNYNSTLGKVSVDGKSVNVTSMPSLLINNTALVQAKSVFYYSSIGASYKIDKEKNTLTLSKGNNTVVISLGTNKAIVNGKAITMETSSEVIKNGKTGYYYIMVPARFVSNSLGYDYSWNSSTKTSVITTRVPEKESSVYFNLNSLEGTNTSDINYNYITNVTAGYDTTTKKDYFTVTALNPITPIINTDNTTTVTLDYPGTINNIGEQIQALTNSSYIQSVTVTSTLDQHVLITIVKNKDVLFQTVENGNQTTISFGGEKKKIKIAIDAGHGKYTAGKRTPKMPVDIDFEGDGIIDIKKGESITEHIANVGVSKYLAEELERCGFEVYKSAFGDTDVPLTERQANIKNANCDYSISVHFNASGDGKTFNSGQGVEVYYHKTAANAGDGKALAQALQEELVEGTEQLDRDINSASLAMTNASVMDTIASVLVECAFMTNENEAINMMGKASFWKETAQDIARGMCNYLGVTYIPE